MSRLHRFVPRCSLLTALLTIAACSSSDSPTAPEGRPRFSISDAVHEGGTPGFYFLPPLAAQPTFGGTFDASIGTLNPQVALCDVTNGPDADCGAPGGTPAVTVFTTTSTPAITIDSTTPQYRVNWDTKAAGFVAGHTYRMHLTAGASGTRRELGFADVLLATSPGQAGSSQGGDLNVVNAGRTLPIHFRIETGIPGGLTVSTRASTVGPTGTAPISGTVVDLHGAPLAGATVAWTVTTAPATGVADAAQPLTPTTGLTDAAGTTATTFKAGSTPGSATVRAASAGLSALLSVSVTSAAAAIAASSPITQSAPAGTTVASAPAVIVRDAAGNPVAGVAVTFAVTSGGGTVIPAAAVTTDAGGIATVTSWTLGPTAETNTLTATAAGSGIAGNPVTFTATTRGSFTVTTTTTGSAQPEFYFASFAGPGINGFGQVGTNGSTTFSALPVGSYTVTLSGVPANCAVTPAGGQPVSVAGGGATVVFTVSCSATVGEISGRGQIGTGAPAPGNDVVTFDFDVKADLTGRFSGTDFGDLHGTTPATLTTDAGADPETRVTAYRSSSSACSDPNAGVEFDAIGREDTGTLVSYTAYLCDVDGAAASGGDFFKVFIPSENFTVAGTLTSGDIVKK